MRRRLRKGGDSINSFMAWVGGKKALRDEILARFPRNYKRYIEVFGGAGWVLFHKPPGNDFEVLQCLFIIDCFPQFFFAFLQLPVEFFQL